MHKFSYKNRQDRRERGGVMPYYGMGFSLLFLLSALTVLSSPLTTHIDKETLKPFLEKNCVECHGAEEQEGQVRFDEMSWVVSDNDTAQRWQDVLDQLNSGDMPPWDADVIPSDEELIGVLGVLTENLQEARKKLTARVGETQMRRLNRREYASTIKDLFGFELNLFDIPEDGESETFDTVGTDHLFSSAHLDKYLTLGRRITKHSLKVNTQGYKKVTKERIQPEKRVTENLRKKVAKADQQKAIKEAGGSWKEMGFKDEGAMKILFRQWNSRVEKPRKYLEYPLVGQGVYISDMAKRASANRHIDHRAEYIVRIHGGVHDPDGKMDDIRRIIRVRDQSEIFGTLKLHGTPEKPQTVEMRTQVSLGKRMLSATIRENMPNNTINSIIGYANKLVGKSNKFDPRASIWIDWIEIEGPFYPKKRPIIEDLLFPDMVTGQGKPVTHKAANIRQFISDFAYHAFRRLKPDEAYIDALYKYYEDQLTQKVKPTDALSETMAVILSSPSFLYIQEGASNEKGGSPLSNRELAVRLSYFLWSSPPDEELYTANLSSAEEYAHQVERLLSDPKAEKFKDGFISQWAEFDRFNSISIDSKKYIRFNEGLQQDAKQEVREFFGEIVKENLPVETFIDSDFLMLNGALAAHYDIPFPKPQGGEKGEFIKVKLPKGSPRGGLLTQTAFLVAGSNGERSSPVIRGSLILEKFLHNKPAPPPPNVPELGVDTSEPHTNRELVTLHQSEPTCASCHSKIDPVGFGLENFDTIGRWRESEPLGRKKTALINARGQLPDGAQFKDVHEFKKMLFTAKDKLAEELIESLFSYGLGRTIEFSDQDAIEEILLKTKAENYQMRDLIKEVASSELFKAR